MGDLGLCPFGLSCLVIFCGLAGVLRDSLCILCCGVFAEWFVSFLFACFVGLSWHLGFVCLGGRNFGLVVFLLLFNFLNRV